MESQVPPVRPRAGWSFVDRWAPVLDPATGVVAAGLATYALFRADIAGIDPRLEDPDVVAVVATVVAAGALAWRRTRPVWSFGAMFAGSLVVSLSDHYIGLLSVLVLVSLYSLAAHGRRVEGLAGLGFGLLCFGVLALLDVPDLGTSVLLQSVALLVAAWALGDAVRSRRLQQLERQRELLEGAIGEERLRIARELHDVVAHSMSLIAVQAGVGAHVIRTDVDAAEQSLLVIADTSRQALDQTRSVLGLLREGSRDGTRSMGQGIDDLPQLVADLRAAGLEVRLVQTESHTETGTALDAVTSLAAYRIVQESLTNVVKHSRATTADVSIARGPEGLVIEVSDPGPGRPEVVPGSGHGLVGLSERARILGGTLEAGPHDDGFRVRAVLPTGGTR